MFLDAAELMSTFMVNGYPDPKIFKLEQASRDEYTGRSRKVRLLVKW
jgi:hypothetical protein